MAAAGTFSSLGLKTLNLPSPQQKVFDNKPFPLVVSPQDGSQTFTRADDVVQWLSSNKEEIENILADHGAILFRQFPIETPVHFDQFVKSFRYSPLPYLGGAAPRKRVVGDVFTANEAPPQEVIYFHNEMAYLPVTPDCVFFYCDLPPAADGETPLVLSKRVYQELQRAEPEFLKEVEDKGFIYSRIIPDGSDNNSSIGQGWQASFEATSRAEAEKKVLELYGQADWLEDGSLKVTSRMLPGVREDMRSGENVWFNTAISAYRNWKDVRNKPGDSVRFGDNTRMDPDVMSRLEAIMEENAISFKWQKGDVLIVDNLLALHGRRYFTPPRRILASLCKREQLS